MSEIRNIQFLENLLFSVRPCHAPSSPRKSANKKGAPQRRDAPCKSASLIAATQSSYHHYGYNELRLCRKLSISHSHTKRKSEFLRKIRLWPKTHFFSPLIYFFTFFTASSLFSETPIIKLITHSSLPFSSIEFLKAIIGLVVFSIVLENGFDSFISSGMSKFCLPHKFFLSNSNSISPVIDLSENKLIAKYKSS